MQGAMSDGDVEVESVDFGFRVKGSDVVEDSTMSG